MSDRTPEPVDQPVEMSWPQQRTGDLHEVAAATRAAAARARAEARLAAPEPPLENTGRIERDGDDSLISAILDPDSDGSDGPADRDDPSLAPDPPTPSATSDTGNPAPATGGSGMRRLVSAAGIMMAGTVASRVLGLVRVILAAYLLGNNSRQAEIWSLATTVPNSLYILLAGGALNTVLVPQIVRAVKNDPDGGEAYTNRIMTAFLLLVAVMAVIFVVAAPGIAWVYSDGAWHAPALAPQFASMVLLTALCMPQVFFYGAFFLFGQVLNARENFGPMMWAPIANNVVAILVLSLYAAVWGFHGDTSQPFSTAQALLLGLGSVVGIATQTAVLVPYLRRVGFHFKPRFDFRHTGLGHTFHVAKWTLGFVAVNQLALLVVTRLGTSATAAGTGAGMAAYYNANLIWVLPHSLITVSLATAILPSMSRMAAAGEPTAVGHELTRAIRLTTTALVPVSLLYAVLGLPIAMLAFRGATKGGDLVGWTLVAFAVGLIPFTVQYLVLRAFYAFEDTRSTFFLQVVIAGLNAGLALLFVSFVSPGPNWVAPALALAYSLAYALGLALSVRWFLRHVPTLDVRGVVRHTLTVAGAALPAALVAYGIVALQKQWSTSLPADLLGLAAGGLLAVGVYVAMTRVLGVTEVTEVLALVRRRGGRKETAVTEDPQRTSDPQAPLAEVAAAAAPVSTVGFDAPGAPGAVGSAAPDPAAASPVTALAGDAPAEDDWPQADFKAPPRLPVGEVLGGRFRLEDELAVRGSTVTWRATDTRLSRSVLVHVLAADDADTPAIVAAAKQAAQTTDARFLRVLDAVDQPGADSVRPAGADEADPLDSPYVVCEWADGLNLRNLLAGGPLTALESAWLVHQLADALAGTHASRMYHQRLNPDTVVVTTSGNVKTVGFMIEAAMHERVQREQGEPPLRPERQESEDVLALGRILYATLASRWPGGPAYGMAAAPITATGSWQTPAQVRAGVSPALDRIADRILNPEPRSGEPLRTVSRIALELASVLGTADASQDLEGRVRYLIANPSATTVDDPLPGEPPAPVTALMAAAPAELHTPVPPPPVPTLQTRRVPWSGVLAGLVVLGLIGSLVAFALTRGKPDVVASSSPAASSAASSASRGASSAPATGPYAIAASKDFDPEADNGNGVENSDQVKNAYDGNPATAWTTVTYRGSAKMGNLKPGVGIVVDLGKPVPVSAVQLQLVGTGTSVDLRVPTKDPTTITSAPMGTVKEWTVVASAVGAGTSVQLTTKQPVTTRFVLVYVTQLPSIGGTNYQAGIAELTVLP